MRGPPFWLLPIQSGADMTGINDRNQKIRNFGADENPGAGGRSAARVPPHPILLRVKHLH